MNASREFRLLIQQKITHESEQHYALQSQDGDGYSSMGSSHLSSKVLAEHIEGEKTVAVKLINFKTGLAKAAVLDFDLGKDLKTIPDVLERTLLFKKAAEERGLDCLVLFSGRKGFHLWFFFEEGVTLEQWAAASKTIADNAGFEVPEFFPRGKGATADGKGQFAVKLPFATHRATGRRALFIKKPEKLLFDEDGIPILTEDLADQIEILTHAQEIPLSTIQALTADALSLGVIDDEKPSIASKSEANMTKSESSHSKMIDNTSARLDALPPSQAPRCVDFNKVYGVQKDGKTNTAAMLLINYGLQMKLSDKDTLTNIEEMFRNTPTDHPSGKKTLAERMKNAKSALAAARDDLQKYSKFTCSAMRASSPMAIKLGACLGQSELCWPKQRLTPLLPPLPLSAEDIAREREVVTHLVQSPSVSIAMAYSRFISPTAFRSLQTTVSIGKREYHVSLAALVFGAFMATLKNGDEPTEAKMFSLLSLVLGEEYGAIITDENTEVLTKLMSEVANEITVMKANRTCELETFKDHLRVLQDIDGRRKGLLEIQKMAENLVDSSESLLSTMAGGIFSFEGELRHHAKETITKETDMGDFILKLFEGKAVSFPTPSRELNGLLNGGFRPGRLYVLGAPPKAGKTTLLLWLAQQAAKMGAMVVFFSFEVSKSDLLLAAASNHSGLNSRFIEETDWELLKMGGSPREEALFKQVQEGASVYERTVAKNFQIIESGKDAMDIGRMLGVVKEMRAVCGESSDSPMLVIVDSIQRMPSSGKGIDDGNATQQVTRAVHSLKQLAVKSNLAVVAISEISKKAFQETEATGHVSMDCFRDSFAINHTADVAMVLQSSDIDRSMGNKTEKVDQLKLYVEGVHQKSDDFILDDEKLRQLYPLRIEDAASYSRVTVGMNRQGRCGDAAFVYKKAVHDFIPVNPREGVTD